MKGVMRNKKTMWLVILCSSMIAIIFCFAGFVWFKSPSFAAIVPDDDLAGGGSSVYKFDDVGYDENLNPTGLRPGDDDYENNTIFYITEDGLGEFATTVDHGCSFEDKKVYLEADIDWEEESFSPIGFGYTFKGTFDGQNHKIYNIIFGGHQDGDTVSSGLFYKLGGSAKIQNLHLDNITCWLEAVSGQVQSGVVNSYGGGIAGIIESNASVTIQNCMITNMTVVYPESTISLVCAGGFVGWVEDPTSVNIINCYLKNMKQEGGSTPLNSHLASMLSIGGNFKLQCSIVRDCVYPFSNMKSYTNTYCYAEPNTTAGLDCSSVGGDRVSIWYYGGADYNNGYPYLRQFIKKWETVEFTAVNGTIPDSIKIPDDDDAKETFSSSTNKILIYNQEVKSEPTGGCHYESVNWTANSVTSYTVTFVPKQLKFKVSKIDGTILKINGANSNGKEFTISCGSEIKLNVTEYAIGNGKCKEVKYTFKDINQSNITISFTIASGYERYYLEEYVVDEKGNEAVISANGTKVHEDMELSVKKEVKSYNTTFE